jgi:hypothetical protein
VIASGLPSGFKSASAKQNLLKQVVAIAGNRLQPVSCGSGRIHPAGCYQLPTAAGRMFIPTISQIDYWDKLGNERLSQ